MVRRLFPTLIVVAVLPLAVAARQDAAPASQTPTPVFKAQSDLVVLDVNVFDGKSDAVPDLPQSAFHVYDAGQPQEITFFSSADVPVAVGLVIDNSSSMLTRRKMVVTGTRAFAESSHPEDEVFTIVFNERVRYGNPDNVDFTTSPAQVEAGLLRFPAGGMTAMYDAVIEALDHIDHAMLQKRALIVLSDGEDNASRHSEADMLHRTLRSDALVYTISTADFSTRVGKPGVLKKLAERTGGVAYFPQTEKAVVQAFSEVAQNIRRGYRIGYTPASSQPAGEYRRIKVLVRVPGRNLSVRVRDGYTQDGEADAR
jgi:Ca-activated chloride channel family protein